MYIRCWGSRGSIPVSGKEYLKYGGDTTCIEVRSKTNDLIIIDAGTGIRMLGEKLINDNITDFTILFTHFHWDHCIGFPVFKPIFKKGMNITIRSALYSKPSIKSIFDTIMGRPHFPVQLEDRDVRANINFKKLSLEEFKIGPIKITSIPLSHPKDSGFGFRFEEDDKSFVFITDNELAHIHKGGCSFKEYSEFCKDADLLIHDAEYELKEYKRIMKFSEEYWGHSVIDDAVRLALKANVKKLGLFHLNAMRSDNQVDEIVNNIKRRMKDKKKKIDCFAVGSSFETEI